MSSRQKYGANSNSGNRFPSCNPSSVHLIRQGFFDTLYYKKGMVGNDIKFYFFSRDLCDVYLQEHLYNRPLFAIFSSHPYPLISSVSVTPVACYHITMSSELGICFRKWSGRRNKHSCNRQRGIKLYRPVAMVL